MRRIKLKLFAVCTPETIHLTACLNRGGGKTSIAALCFLNSPDKVLFILFPRMNAFLLRNILYVLNLHVQTSTLNYN